MTLERSARRTTAPLCRRRGRNDPAKWNISNTGNPSDHRPDPPPGAMVPDDGTADRGRHRNCPMILGEAAADPEDDSPRSSPSGRRSATTRIPEARGRPGLSGFLEYWIRPRQQREVRVRNSARSILGRGRRGGRLPLAGGPDRRRGDPLRRAGRGAVGGLFAVERLASDPRRYWIGSCRSAKRSGSPILGIRTEVGRDIIDETNRLQADSTLAPGDSITIDRNCGRRVSRPDRGGVRTSPQAHDWQPVHDVRPGRPPGGLRAGWPFEPTFRFS